MEKKYVMAIDQGTTGTRVILFNHDGQIHAMAYREIKQIFPHPGWVEHDPDEIWESVLECAKEALAQGSVEPGEIAAIGITNQRESTILWEKDTGRPVYNSICWQCRRTADICNDLKAKGYEEPVTEKTGLIIDPYFSGTKIKWIMDNVQGVRAEVEDHNVYMGNIDSWIIWNLTRGRFHVTDYSNASRTMLLNIHTLKWDQDIMGWLGVPEHILPELRPSSGVMAETDPEVFFGQSVPIAGAAGDQHAATFGQACFKPGMAKNTYGTALALMMNVGHKPVRSNNGLTTDLAWMVGGKVEYSLEGVIFIGGAAIQWLRDGLKIISDFAECSDLAQKVPDTGGVYLVPAFTGLCAPYWDMYARGIVVGITRGTTREHIARSAMESIAYQTRDVLDAMEADSGNKAHSLRVDGGGTKSDFLMQFQADILGIQVERPAVTEMAALGACYLAGLGVGFWENREEVQGQWKVEKIYEPGMKEDRREQLYYNWKRAVERSLDWARW
ncbi:MAG: glycerol kinase GlpK [Spirochaetota bacterium]